MESTDSQSICPSSWRISQSKFRRDWIERWTSSEVAAYQACAGELTEEQLDCHVQDLSQVYCFNRPIHILDVGSGAGTVCEILCRWAVAAGGESDFRHACRITALEPCPAMLELLRMRTASLGIPVSAVCGFSDHLDDRTFFREATFDLVISRQVANGLYDPVAAFENWRYWLRPGGTVILMDGTFDRAGWSNVSDVDLFPLAATKSLSTIPYLLARSGFDVQSVGWMSRTNQHPTTRTPRYVVVARKNSDK
ncbi:MAG: class I SAM-dependent methyltransferase [Planctomycetaceae bacterium]